MKVLITGGAGFIGSNYVYRHLEMHPEDELVILDALTYSGHRENLAEAEAKGALFFEGRVEDSKLMMELFEAHPFDMVVHFAAETHVDRSIKDPGLFVRSNVQGTQTLLDCARDFKVQRFHHISTDEVYGDLGFASTEQFTEESPIKPSSPYSATKAASDLLCLSYLRTYGIPVTISRCSNNYGPYQSLENFIPLMISRAAANEKLPVYGTGENVRDWLYVTDHCDAILSILEKGRIGEIYNIGADNDQKNIDIVRLILEILGKSTDLISFVPDRPGHDERYSMNYAKMNRELGWKPKKSFEEGMRETIAWYTLNTYERNYSGWRNWIKVGTANQGHKQTSSANLQ